MSTAGQEPRWGIILDAQKPVPVYHRWGSPFKTACGRRIGGMSRWLQVRHLKMFAKRCKGCFPR